MTLLPRLPIGSSAVAARALEIADAVLARAEAAGPPPAVTGLAPRSRGAYDRLIDAVNRLPRPLMVAGSLGLVLSALLAPEWFAARMDSLAEMPEPLWWIIGAVLSLHFGARFQDRSLDARAAPLLPPPAPPPLRAEDPEPAAPGPDAALSLAVLEPGPNPALADWSSARP